MFGFGLMEGKTTSHCGIKENLMKGVVLLWDGVFSLICHVIVLFRFCFLKDELILVQENKVWEEALEDYRTPNSDPNSSNLLHLDYGDLFSAASQTCNPWCSDPGGVNWSTFPGRRLAMGEREPSAEPTACLPDRGTITQQQQPILVQENKTGGRHGKTTGLLTQNPIQAISTSSMSMTFCTCTMETSFLLPEVQSLMLRSKRCGLVYISWQETGCGWTGTLCRTNCLPPLQKVLWQVKTGELQLSNSSEKRNFFCARKYTDQILHIQML